MKQLELKQLLQDMSFKEKVNQMLQVAGHFYQDDTIITGPMKESGFTEENIAMAGSVLGIMGAGKLKKIQKKYIKQQPHKIPLLFMMDVINGYRTIFPIPLGQGATFEPELSRRCAVAAAKEAAVSGLHVTFSPMADLVRDARWGRVMESTGEDPYLNCLFAEAIVNGYQGTDLKEPYRIAACIKHFAGYGAPTAGRDYNTVELSEHTLQEFYLPSYQAGIDAGSAMVMTSFNTIEGVPATGNKWLMRKILREEMGFQGVLISDWTAIEELIDHGYCADREEAAVRAINAGVDIDMMTGIYSEKLEDLVKRQIIDEEMIDESVLRILELKNKLGLFENPYKDADEEKEKEYILCKEHKDLAREAARKSFVLLKNENILPIKETQKIAFVGPYTCEKNMMGSWSFIGKAEDSITIEEAANERLFKKNITFHQGCSLLAEDISLEGFTDIAAEVVDKEKAFKMQKEAIMAAKEAELVIMPLGEHKLQSGEATSEGDIKIPKQQLELFHKVCEVNPNVVVVLFTGRPLDIREIAEKAKGIIVVWMPGTMGGPAIIDILTGDYNPSGKLPMSFPYCIGQVPVHYNEYATGRPHVPGRDKDRFRSKYLDIPNAPLYPFGYGLSYSQFLVSEVYLEKDHMSKEDTIKATVIVKNEGSFLGTEVIQLYIQDISASVVRPVKELKAFKKVILESKKEVEVCFEITEEMLRFISENKVKESEPGKFMVYIGQSSNSKNGKEFYLDNL